MTNTCPAPRMLDEGSVRTSRELSPARETEVQRVTGPQNRPLAVTHGVAVLDDVRLHYDLRGLGHRLRHAHRRRRCLWFDEATRPPEYSPARARLGRPGRLRVRRRASRRSEPPGHSRHGYPWLRVRGPSHAEPRRRRIWASMPCSALPCDLPEMLVAGRERAYLAWMYRSVAYMPTAITEEDIDEYARCYAAPGGMRAGFEYYRALFEDVDQNQASAENKLPMPVLALGAERGWGLGTLHSLQAVARRFRVVSLNTVAIGFRKNAPVPCRTARCTLRKIDA